MFLVKRLDMRPQNLPSSNWKCAFQRHPPPLPGPCRPLAATPCLPFSTRLGFLGSAYTCVSFPVWHMTWKLHGGMEVSGDAVVVIVS